MLPIMTSARESAKPTEYDNNNSNNNKKVDVYFDCIEVSANSRYIYIYTHCAQTMLVIICLINFK